MAADKLRKLLLSVAVCVSCSGVSAGYYEGFEAYTRGDFESAMKEWKKVAEPGFSLFGSGIPDDPEERQEMADARYAIGLLYWNGKGVQQNYKAAAKWMKEAAALGHAEAQLKLGYMHINGQGVPRDTRAAEEWLAQSAKQGNMDAQYNLAVLYYKGLTGEPDVAKARYWFSKAAEQGDKVSARVLKDLDRPGQAVAMTQAESGSVSAAPVTMPPRSSAPSPAPEVAEAQAAPVSTSAAPRPSFSSEPLQPPRWLAAKGGDHYTIQLLASSSEDGIQRVASRHSGFGPFSYYTKRKDGQQLYVLVQGAYADVAAAKRGLAALPEELKKNQPYPVRIGKLGQYLN